MHVIWSSFIIIDFFSGTLAALVGYLCVKNIFGEFDVESRKVVLFFIAITMLAAAVLYKFVFPGIEKIFLP